MIIRRQISCFEHYRCGAFSKWIFDTKKAKTKEIEGFIKLALSDPEEGMGLSAIVDLINASWLTDEQFKSISSLETLQQKIPQEINKIYILRELRKESISGEIFKKCMDSNNSGIQRKLLDHSQITKDMINELAINGSSKKIRNIATQLLRSKQYQ